MDIVSTRLRNQHLTGEKFTHPEDIVGWLGAVQAQDFTAAKWSLGLRARHATDTDIEHAFNEGKILRTHIMRPTWHFVLPENIRWMQQLTAPRVKTLMSHYNRKLELDERVFAKSNATIVKTLKNHTYRTRQELKTVLEGIGIKTDVQRLAHIIMWAELDELICSGPRRGKQYTYALLEERVLKRKQLNHSESLAALALTYFTSHGPAQLKDFSWWSGLSAKDTAEGLDLIKSNIHSETVNDKTYWLSHTASTANAKHPTTFLLSIYDEYTIAYKDRSDISDGDIERLISMGNAITAVIIINGTVAGTWKRKLGKNTIEITISPFQPLGKTAREAVQSEVVRYGTFFGMPTTMVLL